MLVRRLILVAIAVVLAGSTGLLARAWLSSQKSAPAAAAPLALSNPSKTILVVRRALNRGQILTAADLIWRPWPEGGVDPAFVQVGTRTPESFAGFVVRTPMAPGEPVTDAKIVSPEGRGYLAAALQPGMRAISLPITPTTGAAGFILPGDHVDILITFVVPGTRPVSSTSTSFEHRASETVLEDIRVIAIDQKLDSKAGETIIAKTATLEVTPKQSQVIALAGDMGKLSLTLRSLAPLPEEQTRSTEAEPDTFWRSPAPDYTLDSEISQLFPRPAGDKGSADGTVTIFRGSNKVDTAAAPVAAAPASPTPAPRGS